MTRIVRSVGGAARRHRILLLLLLASLLVAAAVAVVALVPPAPPVAVPAEKFSAARAFEHILAIAQEPRPIGSPGNARTRGDIVERLRLLGIEPELQTTKVRDYYGTSGGSVEVVNVMARIPGTASTKAVALMGHRDTFPGAPGANDDASAVGIMLETARALLAGPRPRNDVILLFTDGEEPAPRFGSSAFVAGHPWAADIGFLINLEALGAGGPSLLAETSSPQGWAVGQYAAAVPYPAAFSFVTATAELIGGSNSDFATFRDQGVPGVELAYLHGSPIYHTANDAPERVSLRSLHQQGANTLALTRHVGNLDLGTSRDDSRSIFFTVARLVVVRYPETWALPIALVSSVALAIAGWRERAWLRALRSSGATLVTVVVAAAERQGQVLQSHIIRTRVGAWLARYGLSIQGARVRSCNHTSLVLGCCMARPLRIEYPGALYHVTCRGNARGKVFLVHPNRNLFLHALSRVVERFNWRCHAYCQNVKANEVRP